LSLRSIVRHTIGQLSVYPWTFWNGRAALETGPNTCGKRNFLALRVSLCRHLHSCGARCQRQSVQNCSVGRETDGNPRLNQTDPYPNPATPKFKSSHKGLKTRHSRARSSGSVASRRMRSPAGCVTTTCEPEFSVHTRRMIANIASDDALILPHRTNPAG
jgi:hypothetical protein